MANGPTGGAPAQLTAPSADAGEVIRQQAMQQDFGVLRLVVAAIGIALIAAIVGIVFLVWSNKELPEGLVAIGSGAVGALATMLVRGGTGR